MWVVLLVIFSFLGTNAFAGDGNVQKTDISLLGLNVEPGTATIKMPDLTFVPEGMGGAGGGIPTMYDIRCETPFNSMLNTVAGGILAYHGANIQRDIAMENYAFLKASRKYDFMETTTAMDTCKNNPQVCPVVAGIAPRGDQYMAGMVAMSGTNNFMSPYATGFGLQSEAMLRNMAYQNPFMFGNYGYFGGYNYGNTNNGGNNTRTIS